jgi:hypothetical protein
MARALTPTIMKTITSQDFLRHSGALLADINKKSDLSGVLRVKRMKKGVESYYIITESALAGILRGDVTLNIENHD